MRKVILTCAACTMLAVLATFFDIPKEGAFARFVTLGPLPAFLVKIDHEQIRMAEMKARGYRPVTIAVTMQQPTDMKNGPKCCGGIPPWHLIQNNEY